MRLRMSIRALSRRLALSIPRVRRFYEYTRGLQAELAHAVAAKTAAKDAEDASRQEAAAAAEAYRQKLEAYKQQLEQCELKVYVLNSDYQRAVVAADSARLALANANKELEECRSTLASANRRLKQDADSEPAAAIASSRGPQYEELLGRLSAISNEVAELRRVSRAQHPRSAMDAVARRRYLDLLESALTGTLYEDPPFSPWSKGYDPEARMKGRDWPSTAKTMIGTARMRNIRVLMESVIEGDVKGDFLEAGVWRGGACIYMRGILAAYGVADRKVWAADSFAGLPPPSPEVYPADVDDPHHTFEELIVSLDEVKANFAKFELLDSQVVFLPGWFKDTLASAPIDKLAILRLDGDMYQSTIETMEALYRKVSPGGYVIVDDYVLKACREAIHDFRAKHGVHEPMHDVDGAAVFWRKEA
jgi:O-methyltransferase/8-demethyl-8-(2,3-dimethoxy-alpha-L-rhamnosyl)tetracenomycin-C 4'-O-methyltransferase